MTTTYAARNDNLREFLLGTLPETERERLEERLLSDDELYELLLATEEELIDECITGSLPAERARSFLSYLAALPDGRERLGFGLDLMRALQGFALAPAGPAPSGGLFARLRLGLRWLTAARLSAYSAAVLLLLALGVAGASLSFLSARSDRIVALEAALRRVQTERDELLRGQALSEAEVRRSPDALVMKDVVLTAGALRGTGTLQPVRLTGRERFVELSLDLPFHEHASYRAALHDVDSGEVYAATGLTASVSERQVLVSFPVPVSSLRAGDFFVTLEGAVTPTSSEPVSRYDFRVVVE